jgi:integrase
METTKTTKETKGRRAAGRAKGAGSLERHGRTWRAVWTVDGKTYRQSTGTADKREAEKRLAELVAPYRLSSEAKADAKAAKVAGRAGLGATATALASDAKRKRLAAGRLAVPLSKAWERFDTSPRREPVVEKLNGIYETRFSSFVAWAKKNRPDIVGLADVDAEAVEGFMRLLRAKVAPKTYNDYRALFVQVWNLLDKEAGLDGFNPWQEIKPLPKDTHVRRELTVEELARVVTPLEGELKLLFALGIYTGLRMGDCATMDWGAVDLARGFIQWRPRKTKKHGTIVRIPLFPALAAMLAEIPVRRRRGFILPELAEEYGRDSAYVSERVQRIFKAAGIKTTSDTGRANPKNTQTTRQAVDVGFHSLRHTFVSLCANAGVPLPIVQAIVGHTNAAMTTHYFHVSDDALRGAVAALPNVFRAPAALPAPETAEAVETAEAEAFETVPANVARVARLLVGASDEQLAQAEKMIAKMMKKGGGK